MTIAVFTVFDWQVLNEDRLSSLGDPLTQVHIVVKTTDNINHRSILMWMWVCHWDYASHCNVQFSTYPVGESETFVKPYVLNENVLGQMRTHGKFSTCRYIIKFHILNCGYYLQILSVLKSNLTGFWPQSISFSHDFLPSSIKADEIVKHLTQLTNILQLYNTFTTIDNGRVSIFNSVRACCYVLCDWHFLLNHVTWAHILYSTFDVIIQWVWWITFLFNQWD